MNHQWIFIQLNYCEDKTRWEMYVKCEKYIFIYIHTHKAKVCVISRIIFNFFILSFILQIFPLPGGEQRIIRENKSVGCNSKLQRFMALMDNCRKHNFWPKVSFSFWQGASQQERHKLLRKSEKGHLGEEGVSLGWHQRTYRDHRPLSEPQVQRERPCLHQMSPQLLALFISKY